MGKPSAVGDAVRGAASSAMKDVPDMPLDLQSTIELLEQARDGDNDAVEQLFERLYPGLRRWARGRLPTFARELCDTQDIVQDTVLNALRRLDQFEMRHPGALLAYLRQAVLQDRKSVV